jgi:hypothetical protein
MEAEKAKDPEEADAPQTPQGKKGKYRKDKRTELHLFS